MLATAATPGTWRLVAIATAARPRTGSHYKTKRQENNLEQLEHLPTGQLPESCTIISLWHRTCQSFIHIEFDLNH